MNILQTFNLDYEFKHFRKLIHWWVLSHLLNLYKMSVPALHPNYGQETSAAGMPTSFEAEKENLFSPHVDGVLNSDNCYFLNTRAVTGFVLLDPGLFSLLTFGTSTLAVFAPEPKRL